jgi:copper chaperone
MTSTTYQVTGLTCGHCVSAVAEELGALPSVDSVDVSLVANGISTVTLTSAQPLDPADIAAALDEAGDYRLA